MTIFSASKIIYLCHIKIMYKRSNIWERKMADNISCSFPHFFFLLFFSFLFITKLLKHKFSYIYLWKRHATSRGRELLCTNIQFSTFKQKIFCFFFLTPWRLLQDKPSTQCKDLWKEYSSSKDNQSISYM